MDISAALRDYTDYGQDVINSRYENFQNNLKKFMQLLESSESLGQLADQHLPEVDFDIWYSVRLQTAKSTLGIGVLDWPAALLERVALQRELLKRIADGHIIWRDFCDTFVRSGPSLDSKIQNLNAQLFCPFHRDFKRALDARTVPVTSTTSSGALTVTPIPMLIDTARLSEVRTLKVTGYDLTRLVRLCEELNVCYQGGAYHAVIMLTRAILDHVPPLFGYKSFAEVANNYAGTKSFKQSMDHLQGGARNIADLHLHGQIRAVESLPNATQVNFSQHLDLLLAEIVRHHKVTST